jgi:hypothetical protein
VHASSRKLCQYRGQIISTFHSHIHPSVFELHSREVKKQSLCQMAREWAAPNSQKNQLFMGKQAESTFIGRKISAERRK